MMQNKALLGTRHKWRAPRALTFGKGDYENTNSIPHRGTMLSRSTGSATPNGNIPRN